MKRSNGRALAAIMAVAVFFLVQEWFGVSTFFYDSGQYWALSEFRSFAEVPPGRRGYVFALILSPLSWISRLNGDSLLSYRVVSSLAYGIALSGFVPEFFARAYAGELNVVRRLVIPILVITVFPGLVLYPLSDLPGLLFMVAALWLAPPGDALSLKRWITIGALCYASYNIRTIYLFPAAILMFVVVARLHGGRRRIPAILCLLLGAGAVAAPQMYVNERLYGTPSPLVGVFGKSSLMASQLRHGIVIDKYETSVNPRDPNPQVFYRSPGGREILEDHAAFAQNPTVLGYIGIVAGSPVDFFLRYIRHLVNGLDVRDGQVYVTQQSPSRTVWSVIHFLMLLIASLTLLLLVRWRRIELVSLAMLVLPALMIVPGAVETRFLLPMHMMLYGALAVAFTAGRFVERVRAHAITTVAVGLAFCTAFAVAQWITMPAMTFGPL